ncbi:hypothetical protein QBC44DRAFT_395740 [Cladorrhinum sp. PSN332]|nr:hypothetical protein QBC44DRAFT_395740 [Cladorrhinum sp. PSN332]
MSPGAFQDGSLGGSPTRVHLPQIQNGGDFPSSTLLPRFTILACAPPPQRTRTADATDPGTSQTTATAVTSSHLAAVDHWEILNAPGVFQILIEFGLFASPSSQIHAPQTVNAEVDVGGHGGLNDSTVEAGQTWGDHRRKGSSKLAVERQVKACKRLQDGSSAQAVVTPAFLAALQTATLAGPRQTGPIQSCMVPAFACSV